MFYVFREIAYGFIMIIHKFRTRKLSVSFGAKARLSARFEGYNKLSPKSFFDGEMGFASYIGKNSVVQGRIGRYCSIADNVTFLVSTHPVSHFVSTHPCFYSTKRQSGFTFVNEQRYEEFPKIEGSQYSIEVGNDVYIGYGAIIIGPCRIGNGVVVAAGAVVKGDVPDYCIVGGVPAKIIRKRFSDNQISFLNQFQWWEKDLNWIENHIDDFGSIDTFVLNNTEPLSCERYKNE